MLDLLSIYWLAILACTLLGCGLSQLGAQLAARDKAMQTMCVSQGAMFGVLLGIALNQILVDTPASEPFLSLTFAAAAATATYAISERFASGKSSSNTHFAALFVALLAGGHLVSALAPALESHMAQKYFGDLAVMSTPSAWMALALGGTLVAALTLFQSQVTRDSFAISIFGARKTPTGVWVSIATLITLCTSVQTVGFLFTVACLFLPTSILSMGGNHGLRAHLFRCLGVAAVASCGGFVMTLWLTSLPTVPTIVAALALTALLLNFSSWSKS